MYRKTPRIEIGCKVQSTRLISTMWGSFSVGTIFTVIGESQRGYDLVDEENNRVVEVSPSSLKLIKIKEDLSDKVNRRDLSKKEIDLIEKMFNMINLDNMLSEEERKTLTELVVTLNSLKKQ